MGLMPAGQLGAFHPKTSWFYLIALLLIHKRLRVLPKKSVDVGPAIFTIDSRQAGKYP
jgi:hypothetical protein